MWPLVVAEERQKAVYLLRFCRGARRGSRDLKQVDFSLLPSMFMFSCLFGLVDYRDVPVLVT